MNKLRLILESMNPQPLNEAEGTKKKKSDHKWHQGIGRKLLGTGVGAHVAGHFIPGKAGKVLRSVGAGIGGAGVAVGAGKHVGGYYHHPENIDNDPMISKEWKKKIDHKK